MKSLFEQNDGTFRNVNGYSVPNLTIKGESPNSIGVWGQRRLNYLKNHRRILYVNLLTSGKLAEHLQEIDTTAFERIETAIRQMSKKQGVTEQLKSEDQMLWVGKMNNIRVCAEKTVISELICD